MPRTQEITRSDGTVERRKPREGDMKWDGTRWLRWNGRRWAAAAYSMRPARLRQRSRLDLDPAISPEKGRQVLNRAVEDQVVTNGAWVVLNGANGVILGYRHPTSHLSHAFMTFLTMGLWIPIWIVASLIYREERVRLTVDDWGNVWTMPLPD